MNLSSFIILSTLLNFAAADCEHYGDCASCASARGWDGGCRWCAKDSKESPTLADSKKHCHDPGSFYNPCSSSESITNPMSCPINPAPAPAPAPVPPPQVGTIDSAALLQKLFDALKLSANATTCVHDVGSAGVHLRDFATAVSLKNVSIATRELGDAFSALSSSVNDCAVPGLQTKLDALAARLHWANVSKVDAVIKVLIGASEIWPDLEAVAAAVAKRDPAAAAAALAQLESEWTTVTGGCNSKSGGEGLIGSSNTSECEYVDGLLRVLGLVAEDFSDACAQDVAVAIADIAAGAADFAARNYTGGVAEVAAGLDALAVGIGSDACNLKGVAAILKSVAPKLEAAIVNETAAGVKIIVGGANVYDELYQAAAAVVRGDVVGFGEQIGKLLVALRASNCKTDACAVLEGLLAALQLEAGDYSKCAPEIDAAHGSFEEGVAALKAKQWVTGLASLGRGIADVALAVDKCGLAKLSAIVQNAATKMGDAAAATAIGHATRVVVDGADVVDELAQAVADFEAKSYTAFGADLAQMATQLDATGCNRWVCKVAEGILMQAGVAFKDLRQCEADFKNAENEFTAGTQAWAAKNYEAAVKAYAAGLNTVAGAIADCGISQELGYLQQEANALGIAHTSVIGEVASIVVHGADFYEEIYACAGAFEKSDYRGAGKMLGSVLNTLSEWTRGHSCTNDLCYVVEGVMEFMGDIEGDIKACEFELEAMWGNFSLAFHDFTDEHSVVWEFVHDMPQVKKAVGELGTGFGLMAKAVGDCHLTQLSEILASVAIKLGVMPEVELVLEAIHIIVEGVQIEKEVALACEDYADSNWVGFGYNLAKLLKLLVGGDAKLSVVQSSSSSAQDVIMMLRH